MGRVKRIKIKEFREIGLLQEVNRQFFHPLGLALEVILEDDDTEKLGGVWDYRKDPEGIHYLPEMVPNEEFQQKAASVKEMQRKKMNERVKVLGYYIQPLVLAPKEKELETMTKEELIEKCKSLQETVSVQFDIIHEALELVKSTNSVRPKELKDWRQDTLKKQGLL